MEKYKGDEILILFDSRSYSRISRYNFGNTDKLAIICDLDNTVFDCQSRLQDFYSEYDLLAQTDYSYEGKITGVSQDEILDLYDRPEFYERVPINQEVVTFLKHMSRLGCPIEFISASRNYEIHKVKDDLIKSYDWGFKSERGVLFDGECDSETVTAIPFQKLLDEYKSKDFGVIVVDDSLKRMGIALENGVDIVAVHHPYNTDMVNKHKMKTVRPSYWERYYDRALVEFDKLWK